MAIEAVSDIKRAGTSAFVAGSGASASVTVSFANGNSLQEVTVTDASVSAATPPTGFWFKSSVNGVADMDLQYSAVLYSVSTGSFVVKVQASDPEGDSLIGLPIQSVILNYTR